MREIKFRVWDKINKIMTPLEYNPDEFFFAFDNFGKIEVFSAEDDFAEPLDGILMQFTGLHDKNGKEIYEGDIVKGGKSYYIEEVVGVVKYGGLAFAYAGKTASGKEWFNTITSPNCTKDVSIEVIGNIYETPELLEVNNE